MRLFTMSHYCRNFIFMQKDTNRTALYINCYLTSLIVLLLNIIVDIKIVNQCLKKSNLLE